MPILPFLPSPPKPPQQPPIDPLAPTPPIPLPTDGRGSREFWTKEITAASERVEQFSKDWDQNVLSYRAKPLDGSPTTDTVVVPRDFSYVEQKKAQLFFQTPEIHLTPLQDGLKDAVPVFQAVMNSKLGEEDINALATMHECVFDGICAAGIMCSVIGFEAFANGTDDVQTGEQPDPDANMVPVMTPTPRIVHRKYFFSRLSPKTALVPNGWTGSVYDRSPYLGYKFEDDWGVLKKRYRLSADMARPSGHKPDDDKLKLPGEPNTAAQMRVSQDKVSGVVLWYHTAWIDPTEVHPEKFRELVLLDGMPEPLVHRESPYQEVNDQTGELMGMLGNPIHFGSLRYVSDSAFPPSECSIGRGLSDELNRGRSQQIISRDRSRPMRFADIDRVGGEAGLEKIRKNIDQSVHGVNNLDANNPPVIAVGLAHYPPEDFRFNEIIDSDLNSVWAMGRNQLAQPTLERRSATEVSSANDWAESRLDSERRAVLRYYLGAVRKIASLVQMFQTEPEYVEIVGADKVARLQQWDRSTVQGRFAFRANPNSALRIDQTQAITQSLKRYELLAKDPNVNRIELLEDVCAASDLDPKKIIIPQLPPKGPDPANISFRFNAADVDVRNPNLPIYVLMLKQAGYAGIDEAVQQAMNNAAYQSQVMSSAETGLPPTAAHPMRVFNGIETGNPQPAEHGGTAPQADRLSKHRAQDSTEPVGRPPMGAPNPNGQSSTLPM